MRIVFWILTFELEFEFGSLIIVTHGIVTSLSLDIRDPFRIEGKHYTGSFTCRIVITTLRKVTILSLRVWVCVDYYEYYFFK